MMKTTDLVTALRCCEHNNCAGCPHTERCSEECIEEMMGAAADKIEELIDRCARHAEEVAVLKQRLNDMEVARAYGITKLWML